MPGFIGSSLLLDTNSTASEILSCVVLGQLIPAIVIESYVAYRMLKTTPWARLWLGVAGTNFFSACIAWPTVWLFLGVIVNPGHGISSPLYTQGILLILFFFVSVYCERLLLYVLWNREDVRTIRSFTWASNLYSYLLFLLVTLFSYL